MTSIHVLSDEQSEETQNIVDALDKAEFVEAYRKKLDDVTDSVCDSLLDYLNDEFVLRLDDIAVRKAKDIVEALLKGESLDSFGMQIYKSLRGDNYAYDSAKIRASLVHDFKEEIQSAEMLELREENERLKEQLKWARESYA